MISARGVHVTLGGTPILHGVDLDVASGKVTVIVGPNGSGKSTLLKTLCGDLKHQGTITVNGRSLGSMKAREAASMRAVLPQSSTLSFPYTVLEVVRIGLISGAAGVPRDVIDALPELALERVDLTGFAGRYYQDLSGGEQQRVQLARVLCQVWHPVLDGMPRYLLLDEPVSSLDIRHQLGIMEVAREFAAAGGGVLAVLHDLNLTAMFADRVVVLGHGRVIATGTPLEAITNDTLATVFGVSLRVGVAPQVVPFVLPQSLAAAT